MIVELSSHFLQVHIQSFGAEVRSIIDRSTQFEFMWQADPQIWGRTSPVLFPIVGRLRNHSFHLKGNVYTLPQHGFARDSEFTVLRHTDQEVQFRLTADQSSKTHYPFNFVLDISYRLRERTLTCEWVVKNDGDDMLYYSIGAHPGFNIINSRLDDYELEFATPIVKQRHLLEDGLFNHLTAPIDIKDGSLALHESLFDQDAIVLKHPDCSNYTLKHKTLPHAVTFQDPFSNSMGIWTKKGCQSFICIEPWQGYADSIDSDGELPHKDGIMQLLPNEKRITWYAMTFDI